MELNNNVKHRRDRDDASFLTLTVFPRRLPQKGFVILDIDSTALRAAILISSVSGRYPISTSVDNASDDFCMMCYARAQGLPPYWSTSYGILIGSNPWTVNSSYKFFILKCLSLPFLSCPL